MGKEFVHLTNGSTIFAILMSFTHFLTYREYVAHMNTNLIFLVSKRSVFLGSEKRASQFHLFRPSTDLPVGWSRLVIVGPEIGAQRDLIWKSYS